MNRTSSTHRNENRFDRKLAQTEQIFVCCCTQKKKALTRNRWFVAFLVVKQQNKLKENKN